MWESRHWAHATAARPERPATANASAGPADLRQPAGDEAADRREPREGEEVEAHHPPTQVVGRGELDERVRARGEEREREPEDEEEHEGQPGGVHRGEREHARG